MTPQFAPPSPSGRQRLRASRTWLIAVAVFLAAALGVGRAATQDAGFPPVVAGFERVDESASGDTAGYARVSEAGTVSVTVSSHAPHSASLVPSLDRAPDPAPMVSAVIERSAQQVRRFYPDARALEQRAALLAQQGAIRTGRMATFEFEDMFAGQKQPIRMTIYVFCCSDGGRAYQYRFRHAASRAAGPEIAAFLRALPWQ